MSVVWAMSETLTKFAPIFTTLAHIFKLVPIFCIKDQMIQPDCAVNMTLDMFLPTRHQRRPIRHLSLANLSHESLYFTSDMLATKVLYNLTKVFYKSIIQYDAGLKYCTI